MTWPSGTLVRIEPVEELAPRLLETLKDFDGIADDLPADLAANLDHYVHGQRNGAVGSASSYYR